jgi:hypothetical protein
MGLAMLATAAIGVASMTRAAEPAAGEPTAFLGVTVSPPPPAVARQLPLPDGVGLMVQHVYDGSPADAAGLEPYDVLHKLDDQLLIHPAQLTVLVGLRDPGETVSLHRYRAGEAEALTVELGERPGDLPPAPHAPPPHHRPDADGERHRDELWRQWQQGREQIERWTDRQAERFEGWGEQWEEKAERFAAELREQLQRAEVEARQTLSEARRQLARTLAAESVVTWKDDEHLIVLTDQDGDHRLLVETVDGRTLYDGPVDEIAAAEDLTPDVKHKIDRVLQLSESRTKIDD